MLLQTNELTWNGCAHTLTARAATGTLYTIEWDGLNAWLWIGEDPQMDPHTSMDDAMAAAETDAWISGGRLSPVDALNARICGLMVAA